jgi:hypothetical protein
VTQPDHERARKADLQQLETRLDGRFQAVNARFIAVDGRFATLGDRINDIGQNLAALDRSTTARCKEIDRTIDQALAQLDQVQADLAANIAQAHNDLRRIVILGFLGTVLSTAMLCLGMLVLTL